MYKISEIAQKNIIDTPIVKHPTATQGLKRSPVSSITLVSTTCHEKEVWTNCSANYLFPFLLLGMLYVYVTSHINDKMYTKKVDQGSSLKFKMGPNLLQRFLAMV